MKITRISGFSFLGAALGWAMALGLIACGKNSDNNTNLTVGSLTTDGASVFSSSSLSGYGLSFQVKNFNINNNPYQQQGYNTQGYYNQGYYGQGYQTYPYQGAYGSQTMTFELVVNNQSQGLQVPLAMVGNAPYGNQQAYPGYTQGYSQPYNTYGGYGNQTQIGGFMVRYEAACYQVTCEDVMINLIFTGNSYEVKQVGIRRRMRENRVVNMRDYVGNQSVIRTIDQMMREI